MNESLFFVGVAAISVAFVCIVVLMNANAKMHIIVQHHKDRAEWYRDQVTRAIRGEYIDQPPPPYPTRVSGG